MLLSAWHMNTMGHEVIELDIQKLWLYKQMLNNNAPYVSNEGRIRRTCRHRNSYARFHVCCETFISWQSQHTNYQMLINVVTESII